MTSILEGRFTSKYKCIFLFTHTFYIYLHILYTDFITRSHTHAQVQKVFWFQMTIALIHKNLTLLVLPIINTRGGGVEKCRVIGNSILLVYHRCEERVRH